MHQYHRLDAHEAQNLAESLDWQESESGELRTYYATANGLQYRLCRDMDGDVEFMQVRAAQS